MTIRRSVRFAALIAAASVILVAVTPGAEAARRGRLPTYAQVKSKFVPMAFFVAKGEPNACGPGCDTWISAEGDFDEGAAQRFRGFLSRLGNRNLPVFFHSRGGLLGQAVSIGDSLHVRRMTASVGRTSPVDCRRKSKAACDKLKGSAGELRARLQTDALCASACVYAVVGGVRRQIPAKASVSVHAPRNFGNAAGAERVQFYAAVDRYLARSGVTPELMKVTMSVPHERIRTLTRKEIVQFGIERSEPLVAWDVTGFGMIRQASIQFPRKSWSGNGTLDIRLSLSCGGSTVTLSYFGYGPWDDVPDAGITLEIDSQTVKLAPTAFRGPATEVRSTIMSREAAHAFASARAITIAHDSRPESRSEISKVGFEPAMREFVQYCPLSFTRMTGAVPIQ